MSQSMEEMIEELTCSICLSLFSTPVTIPCGHNFCSQCLELSWKETYTCPQCRYSFATKPELRKNTLLSNLVSLAQAAQGDEVTGDQEQQEEKSNEEAEQEEEEEEMVREETVMCDSCRKNPASKTCLTCMASFCQDHLVPHLENPTFSDHQLSLPLGDLQQRKCMEHNKLMDHYCWDHSKCICCYCALNHKPCQTYTLEEGKKKKELLYTNLLRSLDQKMERADNTSEDVSYEQRKVTENIKKKKELLEAEFEEIKSLIEEEQKKARSKIEEEEKKLSSKFTFTHKVLSKKKSEFEFMRTKVQSLLQEQDDLQFLKRATKLKDTTSKDPYKPRIEFDEKLLNTMYKNTASLRDMIKYKLTHGEEIPEWKTKRRPESGPKPEPEESSKWKPPSLFSKTLNEDGQEKPYKKKEAPEWKPKRTPEPESEESSKWKPHFVKKPNEDGHEKPHKKNKQGSTPASDPPDAKPRRAARSSSAAPLDSREQLLKYAERLAANFHTAHKKVFLYDRFTKMAVSETPQNYPDTPHRFVSCSQVLCHQAFRGGIHYWEVEKEGGNFSGFGVAYQSIARFGTESRLGRNKVSWCIEWCNGKLQAWHDDKQTDLTTPNTSKYGVLLNFDDGYIAFFCVGKKCSQIYKFNARFTEPVYPAFWMFSSKTVLTLCQSYEP